MIDHSPFVSATVPSTLRLDASNLISTHVRWENRLFQNISEKVNTRRIYTKNIKWSTYPQKEEDEEEEDYDIKMRKRKLLVQTSLKDVDKPIVSEHYVETDEPVCLRHTGAHM